MKRRIFLIILLLCLLCASAAQAKTYVCEDVCQLEYPDEWYDYGPDSSGDVEGEYYNIGFFGGTGDTDLNVSVDLFYYPEYADVRLFSADEETVQSYADMLLDIYPEAELLEVVRVSEYEIPFIVIRSVDEYGDHVTAETIANGWNLVLDAFAYTDDSYEVSRELTDEDLACFAEIVASFQPVLKGDGA